MEDKLQALNRRLNLYKVHQKLFKDKNLFNAEIRELENKIKIINKEL